MQQFGVPPISHPGDFTSCNKVEAKKAVGPTGDGKRDGERCSALSCGTPATGRRREMGGGFSLATLSGKFHYESG